MLCDNVLVGVAAAAQGVACTVEEQQVVCLVRLVAGGALALGKGCVDKCIFPCQLLVTGETILGKIISEHGLFLCRMGKMAAGAVALKQGRVDNAPGKLFLFLLMTAVTEPILPFPQQAFVAGDMGIMTQTALPLCNGLMYEPGLKCLFVVATETYIRGQGEGDRKQQSQERGQERSRAQRAQQGPNRMHDACFFSWMLFRSILRRERVHYFFPPL